MTCRCLAVRLDLLDLVPGPQDHDVLDTDAAGQVRGVRRRDDLDAAHRAVGVVACGGRLRLLAEVVQQHGLQLGMQVRFGLFDQEERQLGFVGVPELQDDRGDEQQVGVAQAGLGQVGRLDAVLGHLEPQAAGQPPELVLLEAELDVLAAHRLGQAGDVFLDAARRRRYDGVLGQRPGTFVRRLRNSSRPLAGRSAAR